MDIKTPYAKLRTPKRKQSIHHHSEKKKLTGLATIIVKELAPDNYKKALTYINLMNCNHQQ